MSFFLDDADGFAGDFGSNGGLREMLARTDRPALQKFLDAGTADAALAERIAAECAGDKELDYLARLFRDATPPVTLTDGVVEDDGHEPEEKE
jgi:hypothetical protein